MSRSAGDNESLDVWGGVQTVMGGLLEEVEGEPRWGGWRLASGAVISVAAGSTVLSSRLWQGPPEFQKVLTMAHLSQQNETLHRVRPSRDPILHFLGLQSGGSSQRPRPPHETRRRDRGFLQGSQKRGASAPSTTQLASPGRGREAGRGPQPGGEAPSKEVQSPKSAPGDVSSKRSCVVRLFSLVYTLGLEGIAAGTTQERARFRYEIY